MTPEEAIHRANRILAICHVSPDGDAVGALLGLGHALEALGKEVTLACADPVPSEYQFLPGWQQIVARPKGGFDLVVTLDSSDLDRLGDAYHAASLRNVPILNIDHHATNLYFGAINWVEVERASTCELVLALVDRLQIPLTHDIAVCLLNGIVTDTRGFTTPNTNLEALQAAVRLTSVGVDLYEITNRTLSQRPFAMLPVWGRVLGEARLEGEIVWSALPFELYSQTHPTTNGLRGLVSFLAGVEEARVAALFTEKERGRVEVSLRSGPGVDVSQVALALGGGGHARAAGFTLEGSLEEAVQTTLKELRLLLKGEKYRGA